MCHNESCLDFHTEFKKQVDLGSFFGQDKCPSKDKKSGNLRKRVYYSWSLNKKVKWPERNEE
jgi:hypothetical protein